MKDADKAESLRKWRGEAFLNSGEATFGDDVERLGRLKPEQKVDLTIDMTDACLRVCADGIRAQNPGISDGELVEKLRERLEWGKLQRRRGV